MMRPVVAGTVIAFILAPAVSWSKDPPQQIEVELTGHILQPKPLDPSSAEIGKLKLPDGFRIAKFADGLINPRVLAVGDDGTLYATRRSVGDVVMLKDTNDDGAADLVQTVASRSNMHGIAIDGRKVYLVTIKEIYVADIQDDGTFGPLERIVDDLPDAGQHADRSDAFVAMHGSWNRKPPSGYEVLRVHFEDGKPKSTEPFIMGFLSRSANGEYGFIGRPFGLAVGKDGSLFVGDDTNGLIYRVTYQTPKTAENNGKTIVKAQKNAAIAEQDTPKELATAIVAAKDELKVSSPTFGDGKRMDLRYSAYGVAR